MSEQNSVRRLLLEVIVSNPDDALAAQGGGADRVELCAALALGGLTPSIGTLKCILAETRIPVMHMLRPREAGMRYGEGEFRAILHDAEAALEAGAHGLVTGFLTDAGEVDVVRCRELLRVVSGAARRESVDVVFHRAFDVVRDPAVALEQLIELGFDRILTSGRRARAMDGLAMIQRNVDQAAGRIQILPGGGLRETDLAEVVARTGVDQLHLSLSAFACDRSAAHNPEVRFGADLPADELSYRTTARERVAEARQVLDGITRDRR